MLAVEFWQLCKHSEHVQLTTLTVGWSRTRITHHEQVSQAMKRSLRKSSAVYYLSFVALHVSLLLQGIVVLSEEDVIGSDTSDNSSNSSKPMPTTLAYAFEQLLGESTTTYNWLQRSLVAAAWSLCIVCSAQRSSDSDDNAADGPLAPVDVTLWPGEECDRPCNDETKPRLCYYSWTLEHYAAMGS